MRVRLIAVLAAAVLGGSAPAAAARPPSPSSSAAASPALAITSAEILEGTRKEGLIRFSLIGGRVRFEVREVAAPDPEALWAALIASDKTHRSLTVSFDARSGRFEPGDDKPVYLARTVTFDGVDILADRDPAEPPPAGDPAAAAQSSLAEAMAHADDGAFQAAVDAAGRAIDSPALDPGMRAKAYRLRAGVYADRAVVDEPPGAERDRLLLAALADDRAWLKLAPNDRKALMHEAETLDYLGAHDEALAIYVAVAADGETDDLHWSLIRQGAIHRARGDGARALAALDQLKAKVPDLGMAYHYHRAWTLTEMGRDSEAVAEINEGMKTQPDYFSAFDRRACALGHLGRAREAAADLREADRLNRAWMAKAIVHSASDQFNLDRRTQLIALAAAAAAKGGRDRLDLCTGFWDYGEHRTDRSPLLPAGQSGATAAPTSG